MALPTRNDLVGLDYETYGHPFVDVTGQTTIVLTTLDYEYYGAPFVTNPNPTSTANTTNFFQIF